MFKLNAMRLARLRSGKCQYETAVETGISQPLISLYERGLRIPKKEHLERLAQCYGTDPDELRDLKNV